MARNLLTYIFFGLMTLSLFGQSPPDKSTKYKQLNKNLTEAQKANNREMLAQAYYDLAKFEEENFDKSGNALRYYTYAQQYYNLLKDSTMLCLTSRAIGNLYLKSGFYSEALDALSSALDYAIKIKDEKSETKILFDISKVYQEKGDVEKELNYLTKAMHLNEKLKDTILQIKFLLRKAHSYQQLNEKDSALIVTMKAIKLSDMIKNKSSMSQALFVLGNFNFEMGNFKKAIKYFSDAEHFTTQKPYNNHRKNIYKKLAECYEAQRDYEKAYLYTKRYASLNDSILNMSRIESINSNAVKYETREREREIAMLEIKNKMAEKKNTEKTVFTYILLGGLVLLLGFVYFLITFFRTKIETEHIINEQKQKIHLQKIRELEDNIKISSMQSMIEGQEVERERISKDLHDSLGGLLSTIKLQFDSVQSKVKEVSKLKEYKSANKMIDHAVNEVRTISRNLQPGALTRLGLIPAINDLVNRFESDAYPDIDFQHYDVPDNLPTMVSLSIYRIIQELLHNAIKHAHASEILIQINSEGDEILIQFEDDGIGYDPNNVRSGGMGLENIKSRIDYLKGQISVNSNKGEGTSTMIRLHITNSSTKNNGHTKK